MSEPVRPREPAVVIVGGGCSGLLVAAQILRRARRPLRVVLIERRPPEGRGVAYGTAWPVHRLNVPSAGMSALPDMEDHFVRWLGASLPAEAGGWVETGPGGFAPRVLYARYLADLLAEAAAGAHQGVVLERVRADAVDLEPAAGAWRLGLAGGARLAAACVVLATGNAPASAPVAPPAEGAAAGRWVGDPWAPGALEALPLDGDVFILGTGLTMIDVVLVLAGRGHTGIVHAWSRRGLVPLSHPIAFGAAAPADAAAPAVTPGPDGGGPARLRALVRDLRRRAGSVVGGIGGARSVVDALRPATTGLWRSLDETERRAFLRHVRPYWEVARHRVAPDIAARIDALRAAGRLRVRAGRVVAVGRQGGDFAVHARPRGREEVLSIRAAAFVVATGPDEAARPGAAGIPGVVIAKGIAHPGPCGLGIATAADGAVLGAAGRPWPSLFAIGPLRRGDLWETTAVPEIREQAAALATRILGTPMESD